MNRVKKLRKMLANSHLPWDWETTSIWWVKHDIHKVKCCLARLCERWKCIWKLKAFEKQMAGKQGNICHNHGATLLYIWELWAMFVIIIGLSWSTKYSHLKHRRMWTKMAKKMAHWRAVNGHWAFQKGSSHWSPMSGSSKEETTWQGNSP